ncbi:S8 family peptidase [Nocardioides sp. CFH 31398]|uniref:S8 family peptidase n=1 Tax=Nocardioides sp. CFH 31398 TaxID=2919579 RepID=UPI001F053449|nr:S8 family peptidase [Nocardioides sp. CFH 31398]MCH1868933.1 S8 family peptidase [Nocardioides sp. CFH 31398]
MLKRTAVGVASLAMTALGATALGAVSAPANAAGDVEQERAPLVQAGADAISGQYIVMLEPGAEASRAEARGGLFAEGGTVERVYDDLGGYSAELTAAELAAVRANPDVAFVAEDSVVTASATQNNATWGIDRIDQRNLPRSGTFTYNATGSGVTAYIIDTGIQAHNEFSGRLASGYTAINDGRGTTDCNGHGTHVAGTVGGTTYGVAKQVTLVPVRVLGCDGSGTNSGVVAGMDWVAGRGGPAVANMSLGGGANTATDSAVSRMTNSGVTTVVAAGNENQNACNVSPARASSAITVASTTMSDARSSFSNWGSCVDIFAPGSDITSAWIGSSTATRTISGTSMASPHVAGVAAQYLQVNRGASPSTVTNAILGNATSGVVSGTNGSPNRLLFTNY